MGVMVDEYKGEPVEELVEKRCQKNKEFEEKFANDQKLGE